MNNGWIKAVDPKSGRTFYANKKTRKTQWERPIDFIDVEEKGEEEKKNDSKVIESRVSPGTSSIREKRDNKPQLPKWEKMYDPGTGRAFYVDHVNKTTTWERPKDMVDNNSYGYKSTELTGNSSLSNKFSKGKISNNSGSSSNSSSSWMNQATYPSSYNQIYSSSSSFKSSNNTVAAYKLPSLDYTVAHVSDNARQNCPNCMLKFTTYRRIHHCRLCGDVFCDTCSNQRILLPLEGSEFTKPVRVCELCHVDIHRGNYFSLRRYLPPLQLYSTSANSLEEYSSITQVNKALSAFGNDLENYLESSSNIEDKLTTVPASLLIPALGNCLQSRDTFDYAIRLFSVLLSVGAMLGDMSYVLEVYFHSDIFITLFQFLEKSQDNTKQVQRNLFLLEHVMRSLCYITDARAIKILQDGQKEQDSEEQPETEEKLEIMTLDLQRAFANMLDHVTSSSLIVQRWCTACMRNLIHEDERRMQEQLSSPNDEPNSSILLSQFVSSGCIMILCSLLCSEDNDTRLHALSSLLAILELSSADHAEKTKIIQAILSGGGCSGSSLSQLLLSSDDEIAYLGCYFCFTLIQPIFVHNPYSHDPLQPIITKIVISLCRDDLDILQVLLQYFRTTTANASSQRKMSLKILALKIISCISIQAWKLTSSTDKTAAMTISHKLEAEGVMQIMTSLILKYKHNMAYQVNEQVEIVELSGIIIHSTLASFIEQKRDISLPFMKDLFMTVLNLLNTEESIMLQSSFEGRKDWSFRSMAFFDILVIIFQSLKWIDDDEDHQQELQLRLELFLDSIDHGLILFLSRSISTFLSSNIMVASSTFKCDVQKQISLLLLTSATFEIIYQNKEVTHSHTLSSFLKNLSSSTDDTSLLNAILASVPKGIYYLQHNQDFSIEPMLIRYVYCCLNAVGNICGSSVALTETIESYEKLKQELSQKSFQALFTQPQNHDIPTMLIGAYGEQFISTALLLCVSILIHSNSDSILKEQMAYCGVISPICDILRQSIANAVESPLLLQNTHFLEKLNASLIVLKLCLPSIKSETSESFEILQNVRDLIPSLGSFLQFLSHHVHDVKADMNSLILQCIKTIKAFSVNSALWGSISKFLFIPLVDVTDYYYSHENSFKIEIMKDIFMTFSNVMKIPSYSLIASQCNLGVVTSRFINDVVDAKTSISKDTEIEVVKEGMKILHTLSMIEENVNGNATNLILSCTIRASCHAANNLFTDQNDSTGEYRKLSLEVISNLFQNSETVEEVLVSEDSFARQQALMESILSHPSFVSRLISSIMNIFGSLGNDVHFFKPYAEKYSSSPFLEECEPKNFSLKLFYVLFKLMYYCSLNSLKDEQKFWDLFMQKTAGDASKSKDECIVFAFILLRILNDEYDSHFLYLSSNEMRNTRESSIHPDIFNVARPIIQSRVLQELRPLFLSTITFEDDMSKLFYKLGIIPTCLSLCYHDKLVDPVIQILQTTISSLSSSTNMTKLEELFTPVLDDKASLLSMINLSNYHQSQIDIVVRVRALMCSTLYIFAKNGRLSSKLKEHDIIEPTLQTLCEACKSLQDSSQGMISHSDKEELQIKYLTIYRQCFFCITVILLSSNEETNTKNDMSQRIIDNSSNLDKEGCIKVASMVGDILSENVISQFHAKVKEKNRNLSLTVSATPEAHLLCYLAMNEASLVILAKNGSLEALNLLVVTENEMLALTSFKKVSTSFPKLILKMHGHESIMEVLISLNKKEHNSKSHHEKILLCFEILKNLAMCSLGRSSIASSKFCGDCISAASVMIATPRTTSEKQQSEERESNQGTESFPTGTDDESASKYSNETLPVLTIEFLSGLVQVEHCLKSMQDESIFTKIVENLTVKSNQSNKLENCSICLLTSYIPFCSQEFHSQIVPLFCKLHHERAEEISIKDLMVIEESIPKSLSNLSIGLESLYVELTLDDKLQLITDLCSAFRAIVSSYLSAINENCSSRYFQNEDLCFLSFNVASFIKNIQGSNEMEMNKYLKESKIYCCFITFILAYYYSFIASESPFHSVDFHFYWESTFTQLLSSLEILQNSWGKEGLLSTLISESEEKIKSTLVLPWVERINFCEVLESLGSISSLKNSNSLCQATSRKLASKMLS